MRVVHKINLAVLGLLAASLVVVGAFFAVSFRQLRAETYRWFDESAGNLAATIGNQAQNAMAYFDFGSIQAALDARVKADPTLLYAAVTHGAGFKERWRPGPPRRGPSGPTGTTWWSTGSRSAMGLSILTDEGNGAD